VAAAEGNGAFVDGNGREVLLRGANLNSFAEYWAFDPALPTVRPFAEADAEAMAAAGFNLVRFLLTWSRVEPAPGDYDEAYLAEVKAAMQSLWARGIYVLVDMHQDGWGPHIAARPDEVCGDTEIPAGGWDGAPAWATLVSDETPRCLADVGGHYLREFNPAAREAWTHFLVHDTAGPGGVPLQDRFAAMWGRVAAAMADVEGVMGYDILNEPNTFSQAETDGLRRLYIKTLSAIRAAEAAAGIAPRIFAFEPSAAWANLPVGGTVEPFTDDPQIAYAPHVYQGSIGLMPLDGGQLRRLANEVRDYGGIPVIVGEWGDWPADIVDPDGYFLRMIALQDEYRWSMAHWNWSSGCGDPHRYVEAWFDAQDGRPWTYESRDCDNYESIPWYFETYAPIVRPALHFAPGRIGSVAWDPQTRRFSAAGADAAAGNELELFLPAAFADLQLRVTGLDAPVAEARYGGRHLRARAQGGAWSVAAAP
jgi:endoglycosylceramidase